MPIVPIQIYSFFAGVGFLDLGFQNANFDIAFVNEYNERFCMHINMLEETILMSRIMDIVIWIYAPFYLTIRGMQHSQIIGRKKTF